MISANSSKMIGAQTQTIIIGPCNRDNCHERLPKKHSLVKSYVIGIYDTDLN